jgi:hypothetical protein
MTNSIEKLRRDAKALKKAYETGDENAIARVSAALKLGAPKHADFLHVLAEEAGFVSWPALKRAIEMQGQTCLSDAEAQLARAATGEIRENDWINMDKLSAEQSLLLTRLVVETGRLPHIQRLVAMGFDANVADAQGMTPFHLAGWEGLLDQMQYFLRLGPDMTHLNGYGGTIFSTVLHGAVHCPDRAGRDHIGCMRALLEHGVALPRKALDAEAPDMALLLRDWADAHPGQVVAHGVV